MAIRTVSNAGGNYNATATWVESAVPTSADDVVFTSTSGQLTVNVASSCKSINFTNYTGTFTRNSTLSVYGDITLVTGFTQAGASGFSIVANGNWTSNGVIWTAPIILSSPTTIITLLDNWTITGTLTHTNAGVITFNGFNLNLRGNVTTTSGRYFDGTTTFVFNTTTTQTITTPASSGIRNNLIINASGTIVFSSTFFYNVGGTTNSTLTYTAGTLDFATNTTVVTFGGTSQYDLSAITIPRLSISSGTHTLLSNLNVTDLTILNVTNFVNGFNINVSGNLLCNYITGSTSGTTIINLIGTGTWSMPTLTTGALKLSLVINTAGTITISGVINYNTETLTYTAGTVITTGSTLTCSLSTTLNTNGITWNNVTLNGTATMTLNSNMLVNGILTLGSTSGQLTVNDYQITASNDVSIAGTIGNVRGTTRLILNGTSTFSNIKTSGRMQLGTFIDTNGTITFTDGLKHSLGTIFYRKGKLAGLITGLPYTVGFVY